MHATPTEISITQALYGVLPPGEASTPPRRLTADYIKAHSGDKHGPAHEHRAAFPDGRVGSHSALARPQHGQKILAAAASALAKDLTAFLQRKNEVSRSGDD